MLIGIAAAVLAGTGVVAVVGHEEDNQTVTQVVPPPVLTTTTTEPEATTSTTAAAVPVPEETTTTAPPTTAARRTTTTRPPRTTTTVRPAAPTTTPPAAPPTSTPPLCSVDQIGISAAPERDSYPAGQPVTVRSTIRNRSTAPCFYRGYTVTFTFRDPNLEVLVSSAVHADDVEFRHFAPGQSITHTGTWDGRACATPPCESPPTPIYSVEATWSFSGGRYVAISRFVVT